MTEVIGFEGQISANAPVSWAAAVVRQDGEILNPVTGLRLPLVERDELVKAGRITLFSQPAAVLSPPRFVVTLKREHRLFSILQLEEGLRQSVLQHEEGEFLHFLLDSHLRLHAYIAKTTSKLARAATSAEKIEERQEEAISAGLILNPAHPVLQALRVFVRGNAFAERVARQTLSEKDVEAFELILAALRPARVYEMEYSEGVAKHGGLDLRYAQRVVDGLGVVDSKFSKQIAKDFDFVAGRETTPHIKELKANSAHFIFQTDIPGEQVGDKIARYLELHLLEQALSGVVPAALADDAEFLKALNSLSTLPDGTRLAQRSLKSDEGLRPVTPPRVASVKVLETQGLTLLGVNNGAINDLRRLEFKPSPSEAISLVLSAKKEPTEKQFGLFDLANKGPSSFLFQPTLAEVTWSKNENGKVNVKLGNTRIAGAGSRFLNAIPSAVIPGSYLTGGPYEVKLSSDLLLVKKRDGQQLGIRIRTETSAEAHEWLRKWADYCYTELELPAYNASNARWLVPTPVRLRTLEYLLLCLCEVNGRGVVGELEDQIHARYQFKFSYRDMWRQISRRRDLFAQSERAESDVVQLTPAGLAHGYVLRRIMRQNSSTESTTPT